MAAMVAGAAFAASVGANVYLEETALSYDGTDFTAFKLGSIDKSDALNFSFAGEKAGASFNIDFKKAYAGDNGKEDAGGLLLDDYTLWFQPIDQLKVTVGSVSPALFGQGFNYWKNVTSNGGYGIMGSFFFGNLTFDLAVAAPDTDIAAVTKDGLNGIAADVKYSLGDYGTFGVAASYRNNGTDAFNKIKASVGYNSGSNLVQNLTFFLNGTLELAGTAAAPAPALRDVVIDGEVAFNLNAFTARIWVPVTIGIADGVDTKVGTEVYLAYKINRVTASLLVVESDWSRFSWDAVGIGTNWLNFKAIELKPAVTGPLGDITWEVAFDAVIAPSADTPFTFSVPVGFSISF